MMNPKPRSSPRSRRDHYVQQGYLRGFVHPDRMENEKLLWVLDIRRGKWSEKSASQIGWEQGFYDYPPDSCPDATADDAFKRLENNFPRTRDHIRANGYESWIRHQDVLVSYAAMMAARSPLFRAQTISQVLSSLADNSNKDELAKSYSITTMRTEIARRPDQQNDFWLWCPLSWDMFLIGSSKPLSSASTTKLQPQQITEIQTLTREQANVFLASPVPLVNCS